MPSARSSHAASASVRGAARRAPPGHELRRRPADVARGACLAGCWTARAASVVAAEPARIACIAACSEARAKCVVGAEVAHTAWLIEAAAEQGICSGAADTRTPPPAPELRRG